MAADFGCGPGYWINSIRKANKIYAIDFSRAMLDEAAKRSPFNTVYLCQELSSVSLPEKIDFALCFNAIMPESHTHALSIFRNIFSTLAPQGRIVVILPSMESVLYTSNILHFFKAQEGKETESFDERISIWSEYYSNPLGYVRNSHGLIIKYWIKNEAEEVFRMTGKMKTISRFVIPYKTKAFPDNAKVNPPWFWGWVLEKQADLSG